MKFLRSLLVLSVLFTVCQAAAINADFDQQAGNVVFSMNSANKPSITVPAIADSTFKEVGFLQSANVKCKYTGAESHFTLISDTNNVQKKIMTKDALNLNTLINDCEFTKVADQEVSANRKRGSFTLGKPSVANDYTVLSAPLTVERTYTDGLETSVVQPLQLWFPQNIVRQQSVKIDKRQVDVDITFKSVKFELDSWKIVLKFVTNNLLYKLEIVDGTPVASFGTDARELNYASLEEKGENAQFFLTQTIEITVPGCEHFNLNQKIFEVQFKCKSTAPEGCASPTDPPKLDVTLEMHTADACAVINHYVGAEPEVKLYLGTTPTSAFGRDQEIKVGLLYDFPEGMTGDVDIDKICIHTTDINNNAVPCAASSFTFISDIPSTNGDSVEATAVIGADKVIGSDNVVDTKTYALRIEFIVTNQRAIAPTVIAPAKRGLTLRSATASVRIFNNTKSSSSGMVLVPLLLVSAFFLLF